jgi:Ca2+-binding EF-hand superfamily protein
VGGQEIDREHLARLIARLGDDIEGEKLEEVFETLDTDKSGGICWTEFFKAISYGTM